jgi:predicted transcriptional regulator
MRNSVSVAERSGGNGRAHGATVKSASSFRLHPSSLRLPRAAIDAPGWQRLPAAMSTLTIELTDDLAARLAAASERQHVPPAQIVQEALEQTLPAPLAEAAADEPSLYDLMKAGFGCVDSGVPDLATDPKHLEGYGRCHKA